MKVSTRIFQLSKLIVLLLAVALGFTLDWKEIASANVAYLSFVEAMGSKKLDASARQVELARFLALVPTSEEVSLPESIANDTSMTRALFIGEYHRYQGDLETALRWYQRVVRTTADPSWQSSLSDIPRDQLLSNGDLLINDLSDLGRWDLVEADTNITDFGFETNDTIALVIFANRFDERDRLAYVLHTGNVPLAYHPVLTLRVRSSSGYLSLATLIDGDRQRQISYYRGDGNWEILSVPLEGDMLEKLYFKFDEPGGNPQDVETYSIWIDWVRLELSPASSS